MKYFSLKELIKSTIAIARGILNVPNKNEEANLIALVDNVLDPLREAYGKPIIVTSGYRSEQLNRMIGGAKTSQHVKGQAVDIRSVEDTYEENKKLFDLIVNLNLPFDQLIDEYNYDWVHVSNSKDKNRKQLLHIK